MEPKIQIYEVVICQDCRERYQGMSGRYYPFGVCHLGRYEPKLKYFLTFNNKIAKQDNLNPEIIIFPKYIISVTNDTGWYHQTAEKIKIDVRP